MQTLDSYCYSKAILSLHNVTAAGGNIVPDSQPLMTSPSIRCDSRHGIRYGFRGQERIYDDYSWSFIANLDHHRSIFFQVRYLKGVLRENLPRMDRCEIRTTKLLGLCVLSCIHNNQQSHTHIHSTLNY